MLIGFNSFAQFVFDAQGVPVDSLNTHYGQNYLVLDPQSDRIAFSQERGGLSDSYLDARQFNGQEVLLFTDWLDTPGMVSPMGFQGDFIYFNEVVFEVGVYRGKVYKTRSATFKPQVVDIPFFENKSPLQSGCLSRDGKYMIISMESNHTYGVEDLYVAKRNLDGSWGRAKNLGLQLNTEFQEVTPFLAEDNKTLFFATNRPGGEGSFDLYSTVRQDNSWRNWSVPVNLGQKINTPGAETSFTYRDGEQCAYYVSSQDSDGYGDIMKIKFKEDIPEEEQELEDELVQDDPVVLLEKSKEIQLKVVDSKTAFSLPAEMITKDESFIRANGVFTMDSLTYEEVEFKSAGYLPKVVALDSALRVGENLIALESIAIGNVITLDNVLFKRGTSELIAGSSKELDLVVEVLNDNPGIKILLKGHTDNTGDPVKNVELSEERVRAVKDYIINQGVNAFRVTGKGYGGNEPIASNATEATRKLNRRVEFEVIEE